MDAKYYRTENSRWNTYSTYKLLLWAWMMNEISVVFSPIEISIEGFYFHGAIQLIAIIFVGIPLVYSEVCIAQYTNCNLISMWNFIPIFRSVGYAAYYVLILKTIYVTVLSSWYLVYMFHSVHDPPTWFTCNDFNDTKCMIKRVDVAKFQHCIESQILYQRDCGWKTASKCFFDREIGKNNTKSCKIIHLWKVIIASCTSGSVIFMLSIKREKFIQTIVKLLAIYMSIVVFILFWMALSSSGTWYATKITANWYNFETFSCISDFTRGVLTCGTGFGIIVFLSRDVSFRSPATMTSVSVPLWSIFITLQLALVMYGGIKTMSFYHGEEVNILEEGDSLFFAIFANTTETLMYFDQLPIWAFVWLSGIFFCLFMNCWTLYLFFQDTMFDTIRISRIYKNLSSFLLMIFICFISCPFYCSDIARVLNHTINVLQLTNMLFFSLAVYWFYGFRNHSVDITFMIGVKPSLYWKTMWVLNPIFIFVCLVVKWIASESVLIEQYNDSYFIKNISMHCDKLLMYILISIYFAIVIIGILIQLKQICFYDDWHILFQPTADWGPRDKILYRSRRMFVPEIMTREFLYRQVKIRGYSKKKSPLQYKENDAETSDGPSNDDMKWSALTSN